MPLWRPSILILRCVDDMFLKLCKLCNEHGDGVRYVLMSLCIFILSNKFLMSSKSTVMSVLAGCCFWLKSVAMVLFMLCEAVSVEWSLL